MGRSPEVLVRPVSMTEGQRLQRIGRTAGDPVRLRRAIVVLMSAQGQGVPGHRAPDGMGPAHPQGVGRRRPTPCARGGRCAWSAKLGALDRTVGESVRQRRAGRRSGSGRLRRALQCLYPAPGWQ